MEAQPFLLVSATKPVLMLTLQRWEEMRLAGGRAERTETPPSAVELMESVFLLVS